MDIFHSYVSLPEGKYIKWSHGGWEWTRTGRTSKPGLLVTSRLKPRCGGRSHWATWPISEKNLRRFLWRFMIWICHIISVKWMSPYRFLIITRFMGNPWDIHWILVITRGIFHGDFPFWWDGNLVIWPRKLVLEDHPKVGKSYEAQWVFSDSSPFFVVGLSHL